MENLDYFCVKCLVADDKKAFVTLYGKYHRSVYYSALRMLQSDDEAQDITQTVFMKVWEHRKSIDPEQNFAAYINTVCRNAVFDRMKQAALDDSLKNELQLFDGAAGDDDDENFRETYYALLEDAVARLPSQRRAVFEACKLKEQSYEKVAREMGISRGTVQDHIVKANKSIREYIKNNGNTTFAILFTLLSEII